MLHGNDISAYQGTTAPAADFVHVKAAEGNSYRNPKFAAQWASAKKRDKHRGGYHFARPEQSSYRDQVSRFLDMVQPAHGESVMLDLEASKLSQADTNRWARGFGDDIRDQAPGITSILYMGGGYATNGTGRGLNQHFDYWMYPQYPSAYQLMGLPLGAQALEIEETRRALNRSEDVPGRTPIAAMTTRWPPAMTPWLPGGLTCGWKTPHIWQFTDNFGGLDASISTLTISQLAGGGQPTPTPTPTEEPEMIERELKPGLDSKTEFLLPPGKVSMFVANADNTYTNGVVKATAPVQIRVAIRKADGTWQSKTGTVGRGPTDKNQPEFKLPLADTKSTLVSVTRVDGTGDEPVIVGAY